MTRPYRQRPFASVGFVLAVIAVCIGLVMGPKDAGPAWQAQTLPSEAAFPDAPLSDLYGSAAAFLRVRNVISGFPDGTLRPQETLNRAQAAKMLLLGARRPIATRFPAYIAFDVPTDAWFTPYIVSANEQGMMQGYDNGTYRPEATVIRSEFFKMLSIAFDLRTPVRSRYTDVQRSDWYAVFADAAEAYGTLLPDGTQKFHGDRPVSRGEAIFAVARMVQLRDAVIAGNDQALIDLYQRHLIDQPTLKQLQAEARRQRAEINAPAASLPPDNVVSTQESSAALCAVATDTVRIEGDTQFGLTTCYDVASTERPPIWSSCTDGRDPSIEPNEYCSCLDPLVIGNASVTWRSPLLQRRCNETECPATVQGGAPACAGGGGSAAQICARNSAGVCQWYSTCVPTRCCDHICSPDEEASACGCCADTDTGYAGECVQ